MAQLTKTIIEAAISGFESQKKSIDEQIAELRAMLNGSAGHSSGSAPAKTKGRKLSAAARERMREAQRLRWAKVRGEAVAGKSEEKVARKKPRFSAATRKALSIAMKKRWAARKAAAAA